MVQTIMRRFGYDLDSGKEAIVTDVVPFWRSTTDPVHRLQALVALFYEELERMLPYLRDRGVEEQMDHHIKAWRDDVLNQLADGVGPAFCTLADCLSRKVFDVAGLHHGESQM